MMMTCTLRLLSLLGLLASTTTDAACTDFSNFQTGDVVKHLGNGIRVIAQIKPSKDAKVLYPGQAMIFNTSMPTGDDYDLGTPHTDFGGPGIGVGGGTSSIFANRVPQGNVLIISEDQNATDPDDAAHGGRLKFLLNPPRFIESIGILDAEQDVKVKVYAMDGTMTQIRHTGRGDNSYQRVNIGIAQVRRIVVVFMESGAVTDIDCQVSLPLCADDTVLAVDFEDYMTGQVVTSLMGDAIQVSATRHGPRGQAVTGDAMIFNSASPSGGDIDLGTPNESFGGPGVGIGGESGTLYENVWAKQNVLIISEDGDSSDPDDAAQGGVLTFAFKNPTYIQDIGILDHEEGAIVTLTLSDESATTIDIPKRGNNSFETITVQLPDVVMMTIDFGGSAALTHINGSTCV